MDCCLLFLVHSSLSVPECSLLLLLPLFFEKLCPMMGTRNAKRYPAVHRVRSAQFISAANFIMPAQTIQFDGTYLKPIKAGCLNLCCKVFSLVFIHTPLSFQQLGV